MKLKKSSKQLVEEAQKTVKALNADELKTMLENNEAVPVDVRDPRELKKEGKITGAFHCPRGLLEFWADPESPYFAEEFDTDKIVVLYCAMGWRSALAAKTLMEMGFENVCHLDGGFQAWQKADYPIAVSEKK